MKTFSKYELPDVIFYNKKTYKVNVSLSSDYMLGNKPELPKGAILVNVLSKRLRGKTDIFRQPYTPTPFIFTIVESKI